MSEAVTLKTTPIVPSYLIKELLRREPTFTIGALILMSLIPPTLIAMSLDNRTVFDVNVWMKPLKFEIALLVYLITLAWFAKWLPEGTTNRVWYRAFSITIVLCVIAEIIWIAGAASYGVKSHFNKTPTMATIYGAMGILALTLTSSSLLYGILIWTNKKSGLNLNLQRSISIGLILTFILTITVGFYIGAQMHHFIGGNLSDAEGLPIFGWARDGGDLRAAHFFATHAMHLIPIFGLMLSPVRSQHLSLVLIITFSICYVLFVSYIFIEALEGKPFVHFIYL